MTHKLRRVEVSSAIEKRILTSLIVSTQFNYEITHLVNYDYFASKFIGTVARWCIDFFDTYEKAPFENIQDIFTQRRMELKDEDADLIEKLLKDISKKYELDSGINVDYSIQQALDYFRTRQLQITHTNVGILLEKNDIDSAEQQINEYTKVARLTSGWVDPLDDQHIDDVFAHQHRMFNFSGELGKFLGGLDRGWLLAVAAGYKRGKTWSLQEIAITAIQQKLKVAFFSLEMGVVESNDRFYKRLLGAGDPAGGPSTYPCFDCVYNQDGSCNKKERANKIKLLSGAGKPEFLTSMKYRPCTHCRFDRQLAKDYQVAWWFESLDRPAYNATNVRNLLTAFKKTTSNMYKFKAYPKFSANTDDIKRDLDLINRSEGFTPDVIIVDQANGLKPENGISSDGIAPHDAAWKALAQLAGERSALVISPTQVTRAALDKRSLKQSDVAQWVGLLGHVDCAYSLNQTTDEKNEGVMRYNKMIHRHDDFDDAETCVVLQKMGFGQVYLDAHIIR